MPCNSTRTSSIPTLSGHHRWRRATGSCLSRRVMGGRSRHIVTREIDAIGHGVRDKWLFRCDGIEMARDGPTPLHVHAVPGLCCMIEGAMTVNDSGTAEEHCEGDWWYETNVQPIVARSTGATGTRFIRVMIAAPELEGFRATQFVGPAEQKQYQAKGRGH